MTTGKPYRPSNGTEGMVFQSRFCDRCTKDDPATEDYCPILNDALAFDIAHPSYPKEWIYAANGEPICTEFEAAA